MESLTENIFVSDDKSKLNINLIHEFLTNSYWAKGVSLDTIKTGIENSFCFGLYESDKQIGFARVITDCARFAYLLDVFIIEKYRGKGLSKKLLNYIFSYPKLKEVKRWLLATTDAHGLYEKFGFETINESGKYMRWIRYEN